MTIETDFVTVTVTPVDKDTAKRNGGRLRDVKSGLERVLLNWNSEHSRPHNVAVTVNLTHPTFSHTSPTFRLDVTVSGLPQDTELEDPEDNELEDLVRKELKEHLFGEPDVKFI